MVGIYRDTEHDLEAAEEQVNELQDKLGEKWDKIAELERDVDELTSENKRLLDDNRKLHEVQDDLQEIKRKLQEKVRELEAELQRRSFATGNVQLDQIKSLEMKIAKLEVENEIKNKMIMAMNEVTATCGYKQEDFRAEAEISQQIAMPRIFPANMIPNQPGDDENER